MRAKKSLGQNFLNSSSVARDIVTAGSLTEGETVVEIGPGKGFLTRELLKTGAHVVCVEKDDRMIPLLTETFGVELGNGQLEIIHGDIVELIEKNTLKIPSAYKVIANIPYYITGFILRAFLERAYKPSSMILMVQKEVADRILARDKKESILSLSVKAYGVPRIVKRVPARYFTPAPNVDSAVIAIEHINGSAFKSTLHEKRFFEVIKTAFAHKRKQLGGNLKDLYGENTEATLKKYSINPKSRSEDVSIPTWLALSGE